MLRVSGYRAVFNKDATLKDFVRLAKSFGILINGKIAVGMDTRLSSNLILRACIAALNNVGCEVYNYSTTTTPSIFREVYSKKYDAGMIVTSSHNPPEWNGLKFVVKGGVGADEEFLVKLRNKKDYVLNFKETYEVRSKYTKDLVNFVGLSCAEGVKVGLDLAGGSSCFVAGEIFSGLGCKFISINSTPGIFSRNIDPTLDPLIGLRKMVKEERLDAGFAFDGDGDRLVIVDENGNKLQADYTLLICAKEIIQERKVKKIVVSVDTSLAIDEIAKEYGVKVVRAKVGEVNVVKLMFKESCILGGEGSSGGLIISDFARCRDGMLASAIIAKTIARGKRLSELVNELPKYYQLRSKVYLNGKQAKKVLDKIKNESKGKDVQKIDGIKIFEKDCSWVLLRPSNTEPVLRISVEAKSKRRAEELIKGYEEKIRRFLA